MTSVSLVRSAGFISFSSSWEFELMNRLRAASIEGNGNKIRWEWRIGSLPPTYNCIAIGNVIHTHLYVLDIEVHFDRIGGEICATIFGLIGQCLEVDLSLDTLCKYGELHMDKVPSYLPTLLQLTILAPIVTGSGGLHQDQHTCGSVLSLDAYAGYLACQLELQRVQVGAGVGDNDSDND